MANDNIFLAEAHMITIAKDSSLSIKRERKIIGAFQDRDIARSSLLKQIKEDYFQSFLDIRNQIDDPIDIDFYEKLTQTLEREDCTLIDIREMLSLVLNVDLDSGMGWGHDPDALSVEQNLYLVTKVALDKNRSFS